MTVVVRVCASCGHAAFPARALCPRCASREWRDRPVTSGTVETVTTREGTTIAEVRAEFDVLVVARVPAGSAPGDEVALS